MFSGETLGLGRAEGEGWGPQQLAGDPEQVALSDGLEVHLLSGLRCGCLTRPSDSLWAHTLQVKALVLSPGHLTLSGCTLVPPPPPARQGGGVSGRRDKHREPVGDSASLSSSSRTPVTSVRVCSWPIEFHGAWVFFFF